MTKHKSDNFDDISSVEFFFGSYWGNKIYVATETDGFIGVRTCAYGPFLALCKVKFKDGTDVVINKYIDFEMGKALKTLMAKINAI